MEFNLFGFAKPDIDKGLLLKAARLTAAQVTAKKNGQINLKLVDREESRRLNREYAGNDYATDVLSFTYEDSTKELGDIAICLEVAKEQADSADISLQTELTTLVIHGVLHVLGYDHQNQSQQTRFEQLQNGIVKQLELNKQGF